MNKKQKRLNEQFSPYRENKRKASSRREFKNGNEKLQMYIL